MIPTTSANIQSVLNTLYDDQYAGRLGLPFQVWKPEYDKNVDALIDEVIKPLINHLSNSAFNGGLYGNSENNLSNYDKYNGKFDSQSDAYRMLYLYGQFENENEERMRDFNFFWYALTRIESEINRHDLRFTLDIVNREAGKKKKEKVAEVGAEAMIRSVLENVKQQTQTAPDAQDGEDFSFAKNKDVYVPTEMEELYNMLNEKEISSAQTYDLLNHCKLKYNLKRQINGENLRDKGIINASFGFIDINNENDPEYEALQPQEISWIGPEFLGYKGFDDCDAVQITKYIPVTKALLKDKGLHDTNLSSYKKIVEKIKTISKDVPPLSQMNSAIQPMVSKEWGQYWFYHPNGTGIYVCRQHLFFKMIHTQRVLLTIKGKNLTEQQFKDFQNYGKNKEEIDFKSLDKDYVEKAGQFIIDIPIVKIHECVRYGEDEYILVREYPNQLRKSSDWINTGYPVVGCRWRGKSIVTLGNDFAYIHYAAMKKFMEEIKFLSVSGMLNYDIDNLPDGYTAEMIPIFLREKINIYSGSKTTSAGGSRESSRHLTTTNVNVSPQEMISLFNLALICSNTFYRMLGIPIETNIISKLETQNSDQEAPVQGSLALISFYDEFIEDFVNQALQKMADIGRYAWSRDENKTVLMGGGRTKTMKIDPSVSLDEQGIFVLNDYKSRKDKEFLINAGMRALPSGGVSFPELIKMYHSDNPERIEAIFEQGMSVLEKLQAQDQQMKKQAMDQKNQIDNMKMQVPLMVQKEITARELQKQQMIEENKDEREAAKMEFKGESSDIEHEQKKDFEAFKENISTKDKDKK